MHNKALADKQGLTEETRTAIDVLHSELDAILFRPTMVANEKDIPAIVEAFEMVLQRLWNFPIDRKYHRYQFDIKGCTCPKMDNLERIGWTETRIYSKDCIFHGEDK